ncbi:acyl-CoA synthetase (AMP-forming)/AMP-acid ligase II [Litoreibacter meonggei]|uniref:Acyl-CoA synthetase (AMP-forming)/AMP-acid ligase II n=1 Tax=Litoreibacter meonggei TaxID=1049199 RepID=A0A497VQF1_9RHOB|nr:AMP-binding protein [Litoreibacter meonggei]RLJ41256.1 acyl-CoA synthetase (AMP-forming)/AMP-acid ligase II [Litoreibacter meonggei]
MKLAHDAPPQGTVRDWIDFRAESDGVAIVFTDGSPALNWAELRDEARQIARTLTAQGIAKGESIAILQPNSREGVLAFYGAVYGGFRATMVNLAAGRDAMAYALEHCEARIGMVHDSVADMYESVRPEGMKRLSVFTIHADIALHDVTPADHALLMYTSGTTGRPKGVVHTQSSLLAGGWTPAIAHKLTDQDRAFCVLPICHINGLCVTVMGALVSGGSVAMAEKFSASRFWTQVEDTKATWFSVVPTIISHLLHGDGDSDAPSKERLRFGRSASSALAPDVQTAFETRFGIPIIETMGLTETAAQILSNPLPPGTRKIGSPGIAYGNEVAILAADLSECPPDVEGEIAIRGPNVMLEYLKNPEATEATFHGDWLRTGDLGRKDAEGYLFVTGRLKELIIKGGENIAPREIDEALYAHSDVVEAAAFARPCTVYGERVEAAVRLCDGSALTAQDLIASCIEKLGKFKAPDHVHFLPELPKGPSGKIQRLKLAEIL